MSEPSATINLALSNEELYKGCEISEVAGRLALLTPVGEAVQVVGRNARAVVERMVIEGVEEITLTGAMAIWAYLVVFHVALHRFRRIYYDDGRPGGRILVAAH